MTGAGKTHTMFGSTTKTKSGTIFEPGIANLAILDLFIPFIEDTTEYHS